MIESGMNLEVWCCSFGVVENDDVLVENLTSSCSSSVVYPRKLGLSLRTRLNYESIEWMG